MGRIIGMRASRVGQSRPWKAAEAEVFGVWHEGIECEPATCCSQHHLGQNQEPPAIHGVGHRSPAHRTNQRGRKLHQADESHDECRVGQNISLKRNTYDSQLAADARNKKSDPEPPEGLIPPQRGDIRQEGLHGEL
jgi:hypothetical protein